MEDLSPLWNYQEDFDELKLKLQYTSIELESVKMEANEQIRKYRDEVNHLVNLVKLACQERDEARDQVEKLVNKLMASSSSSSSSTILPQSQPENLLMIAAAKANSSMTESSSLSETYNHHPSHGSSPVDSLFDAVTSPDFSSINNNMADNSLIDNLAKGKTLPEKGKLLQAVMEASPLLQTLLVAGPLPRWRNPPPPLRTYKIPPISIKACHSKLDNQKPGACPNPSSTVFVKQLNNSSPMCPQMIRGSGQSCSVAMLDFAASGSAPELSNGANSQISFLAGKRQRLQ
ncbi:hypothetical protein E1A91_A07G106600v1 [Gossypium mustelinum]|uniref:Uncharacterized protein n=1 Tax=Gossypium mustelinum TaxID=34275 RepID=A0A5D2YJK1_GOSMU|nr:hypothetical protein E1A91_A07G106600v1 [Gossypium mustelinum]TYJ26245.1 hypothetical protein E1A91_A07G106600v1 [Gossypium mustelinum]